MKWNWQQKDWPNFHYQKRTIAKLELDFLHQSGIFFGAYQHIGEIDKNTLLVDLISDEALKTSEIEGEYLNRSSLQSSIRRNLGLDANNRKISPAEQGIAEMMVDLHQHFNKPLTQTMLFTWHSMLTKGRTDLHDIGRYRTHEEPMQVISGAVYKPRIHFEAPPSKNIKKEMDDFIVWFNNAAPNGSNPLPALTYASIAHLYFVSIHPFEDGNGRIGRAISQKALSRYFGKPLLIALSTIIQSKKKAYYTWLEKSNKQNEITPWLTYFGNTIIASQRYTQNLIDFIIAKAKFYARYQSQLNLRQAKVIARIFREGLSGFEGGLSAENYIAITHTSRATTTRDLQDLVKKGVFIRTGMRKGTRYFIA